MPFGSALRFQFDQESIGVPFLEVQQFRALIRSFANLNGPFHIEEYHGSKYQVWFDGQGTWARTPARCELCDVLFVVYSLSGGFSARITFLQAKLSYSRHTALGINHPHNIDPVVFAANLEQWDLLSRRPEVISVPPFSCPPRLLMDALIPSVGSFGIFYRRSPSRTGFFYASADRLSVAGAPTSKYGRLQTTNGTQRLRYVRQYPDMTFCCCLPEFGNALYHLQIGTPIEFSTSSADDSEYRQILRSWLGGVLGAHIAAADTASRLGRELMDNLKTPAISDDSQGSTPNVVIIRSDLSPTS